MSEAGALVRQSGKGLGGSKRQVSLRAGVPSSRLLSEEIGAKLRLFGRACLSCPVCDVGRGALVLRYLRRLASGESEGLLGR